MHSEAMLCPWATLLNPIITHDVIEGSVTTETFIIFLRERVVSSDMSSPIPDTSHQSISWASKCPHPGQLQYTSC